MRRAPIALALILAGSQAWAAPPSISHTVGRDDTAELLAAEYYGNRQLAVFIMAANGLSHESRLKPGKILHIPTSWKYTSKADDTLASIALAELGDARRSGYLADVNQLDASKPLAEGTELTIPFHLTHHTQGVESFKDIARAYYGNAKRAELIKSYNFRNGNESTATDTLVIPIDNVKVRPSKLPAADAATAAETAAHQQELEAQIKTAIKTADARTRDGRYEDVVATLFALLSSDANPSESQLVDIHWLLGSAYVALGQNRLALTAFREVLDRRPQVVLDPARVSPKLRAVFELARKQAEK